MGTQTPVLSHQSGPSGKNRPQTHQLLFLLLAALLSGCAAVEPGQHYYGTSLTNLNSAYVVLPPDADSSIGMFIQNALAQRNLSVTAGPLARKPNDVAFYVTYADHWQWDLVMYLASLDIQFLDNTSNQVIAGGSFKQGLLHTFPDVRETTVEVIDSIYKTK